MGYQYAILNNIKIENRNGKIYINGRLMREDGTYKKSSLRKFIIRCGIEVIAGVLALVIIYPFLKPYLCTLG